MRQTENYGFNIPEENEFYDVKLEKVRCCIKRNQ